MNEKPEERLEREELQLARQDEEVIENLFTYHAPTDTQRQHYIDIRDSAKALARLIDWCCPPGPDRTTAMRQLRECVMTANASIATGGQHYR